MDQIVTRDMIRDRARQAFARGVGRNDHHMNPTAPAVADWQAEWDRCAAEAWGFSLDEQPAEACPP